jgi:hypothetical protein
MLRFIVEPAANDETYRLPYACFYRDHGEAAATSARNLVLQSRDRRIIGALAIARKIRLHCQCFSDIAPRLLRPTQQYVRMIDRAPSRRQNCAKGGHKRRRIGEKLRPLT